MCDCVFDFWLLNQMVDIDVVWSEELPLSVQYTERMMAIE